MKRKAVKISLDDFKKKVSNPDILPPNSAMRDLKKIDFSWENSDMDKLLLIDEDFPVQFMWAGGDWENPVFFILYWDGKVLKGYIPEEGNTFNPINRKAYGNEYESGHDDIDERFWPKPDYNKMINDIKKRIKLK